MNKLIKDSLLLLFGLILAGPLAAQQPQTDLLRSNGKIYVVVAVALTILLGLFFYVFRLDRKISRLEKESGS